jgi:hypothetical protein
MKNRQTAATVIVSNASMLMRLKGIHVDGTSVMHCVCMPAHCPCLLAGLEGMNDVCCLPYIHILVDHNAE